MQVPMERMEAAFLGISKFYRSFCHYDNECSI